MQFRPFFLVFFFLLNMAAKAQFCELAAPPKTYIKPSTVQGSVAVDPLTFPTNTPIKYIKMDIHVFQMSDGSGNFQNTTPDIAFLNSVFSNANKFYGNLDPQTFGTSPYITDSRIQIQYSKIYYCRQKSLDKR